MDTTAFKAPGPGPWEIEGAHFPKPVPHFGRDAVVRGFARGFREGTARYGLLLSHFQPAIVNGFWYMQPVPFGAPPGATAPPPKAVLWLLTRLHPAMRARIRDSERAFEGRRWRADLKEWDEVDKPAAVEKHRALLREDPAAMDDAALTEHLARCEAHLEEMIFLHHKYTIASTAPVGDLLAHAVAWTGKEPGEVLAALRGSSRISLGFSSQELLALGQAIRDDDGARALLDGGDGAQGTLDALCAREGAAGDAARALVELVRHRALTYDVAERVCGEQPELIVKAIRAAVDGRFTAKDDDAEARRAALREQVPAQHRGRFDELLAEARVINRLRDERGLYADCWAIGIGRRAALEVGRRLVARGCLDAPEQAVDLTSAEAVSLLKGERGPSLDEVRARGAWRREKTLADAPPFLNAAPPPPPDASLLPPAARRASLAVDMVISNLLRDGDKPSTETVVRGISVNAGVYEGVARRIDSASDFTRIQQGDVLVTSATAPYFNVVLPLLGAIVTDRGGQLCHAAIVAREYGIPGVVGTREATKRIPDGARVRVDGARGEVTILA